MIWLGCSGWSYKEWSGVFYPSYVRDQLKYYSQVFNSVEINSTFYADPPKEIVQSWLRKVGDRMDFRFSIKMPGSITHDLFFRDKDRCVRAAVNFESQILDEMDRAGKLAACLVQVPPKLSGSYWDDFIEFLSNLDSSRYRYFVEPRNPQISSDMATNSLKKVGIGLANVDTPVTGLELYGPGSKYVRLHGRNAEQWETSDERMSKYRYRYSSEEISGISAIIKSSISGGDDIFIYFNNHHEGNAAINAMELGRSLGQPIRNQPEQRKLF